MNLITRYKCLDSGNHLLGYCSVFEYNEENGQLQYYLNTVARNMRLNRNPQYLDESNLDGAYWDESTYYDAHLSIPTDLGGGSARVYNGGYFSLSIGEFQILRVPYNTSKILEITQSGTPVTDGIVIDFTNPVVTKAYVLISSIDTNIQFGSGLINTRSFTEIKEDDGHLNFNAYLPDVFDINQIIKLLPPITSGSSSRVFSISKRFLTPTSDVHFPDSVRSFNPGDTITDSGFTYLCINRTNDINFDSSPNWFLL